MAKPTAIVTPNLGLYYDRPSIAVPPRGLQDGMNFRIRFGRLNNFNLGWVRFGAFQLEGPVRLIDNFFPRNAGEALIFATQTDLYKYSTSGGGSVLFLTPRYATGTVDVSSANPAIVTFGTSGVDAILEAGDKIHFGSASQTNPSAVWYTIASVDDATHATLTTAVAGAPLTGSSFTARLLFTMDADDWWDSAVFVAAAGDDDQWIATNGVDPPVSWNGTDTEVTVHDEMGFTCRAVAIFQNMACYANLVYGGDLLPRDLVNSDIGSPFAAGDTGTGLSEQFHIHDGSDDVLRLMPLGDALIAYSEKHVTHIDFAGDPLVFNFRQSITGIGPMGPKAIADFSDYHQFVAAGTMYRYDGVASDEVNTHIWPEVLRQQDPVRKLRVLNHFNNEFQELMWSVPLTTDTGSGDIDSPPTKAFVEHYAEVVGNLPIPYSARAFPFTAAGYFTRQSALLWSDLTQAWSDLNFRWNDQFFSLAFPQTLVGDADGKVFVLNEAQTGDGVDLISYVRFGRKAIVDGRMRALIRRVYPFVDQLAGDLTVRVRLADHAQGPVTITQEDSLDLSLPEGGHFTSPFRRGRFVEIEFGSTGNPYILSGYDIDASKGGRR